MVENKLGLAISEVYGPSTNHRDSVRQEMLRVVSELTIEQAGNQKPDSTQTATLRGAPISQYKPIPKSWEHATGSEGFFVKHLGGMNPNRG